MKTISVTELKTHLSREIRKIEKSGPIVITDHNHPVALLSSAKISESKWVFLAERSMSSYKRKSKVHVKTDPLKILQEERSR